MVLGGRTEAFRTGTPRTPARRCNERGAHAQRQRTGQAPGFRPEDRRGHLGGPRNAHGYPARPAGAGRAAGKSRSRAGGHVRWPWMRKGSGTPRHWAPGPLLLGAVPPGRPPPAPARAGKGRPARHETCLETRSAWEAREQELQRPLSEVLAGQRQELIRRPARELLRMLRQVKGSSDTPETRVLLGDVAAELEERRQDWPPD